MRLRNPDPYDTTKSYYCIACRYPRHHVWEDKVTYRKDWIDYECPKCGCPQQYWHKNIIDSLIFWLFKWPGLREGCLSSIWTREEVWEK